MLQKLLIYGVGDFAKTMYHYLLETCQYEIIGFCADKEFIVSKKFCQLPVYEFENIDSLYAPAEYKFFIAIGYSDMSARVAMYNKVKAKQYTCINYISPQAIIDKTLQMGENNVIFPNVVIEPFVKINNNNIIWSSCNISHDVEIKSHSFFASQTLIGGFSSIGDSCFIGFNATVVQHISVADVTLIGAKSLVLNDTESYSKYIGIPAKKVSIHAKGIFIK